MRSLRPRQACALIATAFALAAVANAQPGSSIAAMFAADQKRDAARAESFEVADLPASKAAAFRARVYLSAGDLERAFDRPEFRPDAAIVATNTDLAITAPPPTTQRVPIERVRRQPAVMRDLEDQIASRRKQTAPAPAGEPGLLRIGVGTFVAQLPRGAAGGRSAGAFPKSVCLIAAAQVSGAFRRGLTGEKTTSSDIGSCNAMLDAP
jgi:hypothetical protein